MKAKALPKIVDSLSFWAVSSCVRATDWTEVDVWAYLLHCKCLCMHIKAWVC